MKKYRLKSEAIPFFKEKFATAIYDITVWESLNIDTKALEEVEDTYISYGHERIDKDGSKTGSLCGWSQEDGAKFHFTIHFPGMTFKQHDEFSKGRLTRELMNLIHIDLNNYFLRFNNKEDEQN